MRRKILHGQKWFITGMPSYFNIRQCDSTGMGWVQPLLNLLFHAQSKN